MTFHAPASLEDPLVRGAERLRRAAEEHGSAGDGLAVTAESLQAAAKRVEPWAHRTPCVTNTTLEQMVFGNEAGHRLVFKCENFQKTGAFKFRGATNAIMALLKDEEATSTAEGEHHTNLHVVTESSGNHGQAIALVSRNVGAKATIIVPDTAPFAKKEAMRGYGAEVVLVPAEKRESESRRVVEEQKATLVHPSNDPNVMSGQGTVMLEFYEQALDMGIKLDTVIIPIGGGGLCSGVAVAAKTLDPTMQVIAAEPALADDAWRSKTSGELEGHRDGRVPSTIADGLRSTLGSNTWPVVQQLVDRVERIEEREIAEAMQLVLERTKLVIETNSAVAVAAALKLGRARVLNGNVGIVLSGGNVSFSSPLPLQV